MTTNTTPALSLSLTLPDGSALLLPDFNALLPPSSPPAPLSPLPSSPVALGAHPLPIEALRHYMGEPFRMDVSSSWLSQMQAAIGILLLLLALGIAVIWRRCAEKTFWVMRGQERGDGVLLIPNAVTSFLCLESTFATVWVAYALDQILVARGHASPARLPLWLGLTWLPLIQGAWFAGWGTFFASPLQPASTTASAGGRGRGSGRGRGRGRGKGKGKGKEKDRGTVTVTVELDLELDLGPELELDLKDAEEGQGGRRQAWTRWTRHRGCSSSFSRACFFQTLRAPVLNSIMACVPLAQMAVILALTCVAGAKWKPAVHAWSLLDADLTSLSLAARAQPDPYAAGGSGLVTPELAARALALWQLSIAATDRFAWLWWGWHASALSFTVFYALAGSTLLLQLHREVLFLRRVAEGKARRSQAAETFAAGADAESAGGGTRLVQPRLGVGGTTQSASLLARAAAAAAVTPSSHSRSRPDTARAATASVSESSAPYVYAATPAADVPAPKRAFLRGRAWGRNAGAKQRGEGQGVAEHQRSEVPRREDGVGAEEEAEEFVDDELEDGDGDDEYEQHLAYGGVSDAPRHQGGGTLPHSSTSSSSSFWPPIRTAAASPPSDVLCAASPRMRPGPSLATHPHPHPHTHNRTRTRYATMRKVVFLIGVQVICISLAAAALSALTLFLAIEMRRAGRRRTFTPLYEGANLVAAWTACIFGGAIFLAITARTFEFLTDVVALSSRLGGGGGGGGGGAGPQANQANAHGPPAPLRQERLHRLGRLRTSSGKSTVDAPAEADDQPTEGPHRGTAACLPAVAHNGGSALWRSYTRPHPHGYGHGHGHGPGGSTGSADRSTRPRAGQAPSPVARSGRGYEYGTGSNRGHAHRLGVLAAAAERSAWQDDTVVLEESRLPEAEPEPELELEGERNVRAPDERGDYSPPQRDLLAEAYRSAQRRLSLEWAHTQAHAQAQAQTQVRCQPQSQPRGQPQGQPSLTSEAAAASPHVRSADVPSGGGRGRGSAQCYEAAPQQQDAQKQGQARTRTRSRSRSQGSSKRQPRTEGATHTHTATARTHPAPTATGTATAAAGAGPEEWECTQGGEDWTLSLEREEAHGHLHVHVHPERQHQHQHQHRREAHGAHTAEPEAEAEPGMDRPDAGPARRRTRTRTRTRTRSGRSTRTSARGPGTPGTSDSNGSTSNGTSNSVTSSSTRSTSTSNSTRSSASQSCVASSPKHGRVRSCAAPAQTQSQTRSPRAALAKARQPQLKHKPETGTEPASEGTQRRGSEAGAARGCGDVRRG